MIVGTIHLLLAWIFSWNIGVKAFVMVFYSCLFMLNPFWTFDGYWVVADSLGITNFGRELRKIFRTCYQRLRGRLPEPLRWLRVVLALIGVYILGGIGFWGYFLGWVVPELFSVTLTYPGNVVGAGQELLNGTITMERLESLFLPTFVVLGLVLIAKRVLRWMSSAVWTTMQQRQAAQV